VTFCAGPARPVLLTACLTDLRSFDVPMLAVTAAMHDSGLIRCAVGSDAQVRAVQAPCPPANPQMFQMFLCHRTPSATREIGCQDPTRPHG
jgi:hypothetical protein